MSTSSPRIDQFLMIHAGGSDAWRDLTHLADSWARCTAARKELEQSLARLAPTEAYHAYAGGSTDRRTGRAHRQRRYGQYLPACAPHFQRAADSVLSRHARRLLVLLRSAPALGLARDRASGQSAEPLSAGRCSPPSQPRPLLGMSRRPRPAPTTGVRAAPSAGRHGGSCAIPHRR